MSDGEPGGGRTRITARALERVTAAVATEALGGISDRIRVELTDHDGSLDLGIATDLRALPLSRIIADPGVVARSGGSLVERAEAAEGAIRDRVGRLTGYTVRRVAIHVTGVHVQQGRRLR